MSLFSKKKPDYFFERFVVVMSYAKKSMDELALSLKSFDGSKLFEMKERIHAIEHEADQIKSEAEERLGKEFMTPIDREDIFLLLDDIDDITDSIDDISYKMYVRNYVSLPEDVMEFVSLARETVNQTAELISSLSDITNKNIIGPQIAKVRELEEKMDHLYEEKVHGIYQNETLDPRLLSRYEDIYGKFEYVTDQCRDVAKTVAMIMYKNL